MGIGGIAERQINVFSSQCFLKELLRRSMGPADWGLRWGSNAPVLVRACGQNRPRPGHVWRAFLCVCLQPGCVYHVQLKAEGNDHIERALPHHRLVAVRREIPQRIGCDASRSESFGAPLADCLASVLGDLQILIKGPLRTVSSSQAASYVGFFNEQHGCHTSREGI